MSQVVSRLVDAARRGDPMAIGQLLSQRLRSRGIQVRIFLQQGYLQIRLDSPQALPQRAIIDWTKGWIVALHSDVITRVRIYSWQPNQYFPDWMARFDVTRGSGGSGGAEGPTDGNSASTGAGMSHPPRDNGVREFDSVSGNGELSNLQPGKSGNGHSVDSLASSSFSPSSSSAPETAEIPNEVTASSVDSASPLDLAAIPEQDRLAYYGALYAIANVDGHLDPREVAVIEDIINLQGLSEQAVAKVLNYRDAPPALVDCLAVLADADESLRIGLMMNLIDTSWANEELDALEMAALKLAQRSLNISNTELKSIESFVREMRSLGAQSFDELELSNSVE